MTHRLPSTSYILRLPTPLHQICVRFMTGALSTLQLPLNTNCLASCPFLKENWLAAGCYQLSACRTARQGGLHILEVAGSSEEGLDVTEVCSTRLPGKSLERYLPHSVVAVYFSFTVWTVQAYLT